MGENPRSSRKKSPASPQQESLTALVDYIETAHHAYLRTEMPRIEAALEQLAMTLGQEHPELPKLHSLFSQLKAEIEVHMFKEEHVLFVLCRRLDTSARKAERSAGSVRQPVEAMMHEHEAATHDLAQMRRLARDFTPPPGAGKAYCEVLAALSRLDVEIRQHIQQENDVLFPQALAAEAQLNVRPA